MASILTDDSETVMTRLGASPLGQRLAALPAGEAIERLQLPSLVAAAIAHAGVPRAQGAKVLILSGDAMDASDDWRWLGFTNLLDDRSQRVECTVVESEDRLVDHDRRTALYASLPDVRIRHVRDAVGRCAAVRRASFDVAILSIDLLTTYAGSPDVVDALLDAFPAEWPVYAVNQRVPRGAIMQELLAVLGLSADFVDVPSLEGRTYYGSFCDHPLMRLRLPVRDRVVDLDRERALLRFIGHRMRMCSRSVFENRLLVTQPDGPNGVETILGLTEQAAVDVHSGVVLLGSPGTVAESPARLSSALLARYPKGTLEEVAFRDALDLWAIEAFIEFDDSMRKLNQVFETACDRALAVCASLGIEVPPKMSASVHYRVLRAVERGMGEAVRLFYERGDDIDAPRISDGQTPLVFAAHHQSPVLDVLLQLGANPNRVDAHGWTALAYALAHGSSGDVGTLAAHGARLDHKLPNGVTLAQLAAATKSILTDVHAVFGLPSTPELSSSVASIQFSQPARAAVHGTATPLAAAVRSALPERGDSDLGLLARMPIGDDEAVDTSLPAALVNEGQPATPKELAPETSPASSADVADTTTTVMVAQGVLGRPDDQLTTAERFIGAREVVARWLAKSRAHVVVDPRVTDWDVANKQGSVTAEGTESLWAMRFEHPTPRGVRWRAEVVIANVAGKTHCGVRLLRTGKDPEEEDPVSIPGILANLVTQFGWRADGLQMYATPWEVTTPRDAAGLLNLLRSPDRSQPVVVIGRSGRDAWIEDRRLTQRLNGVAHVMGVDATQRLVLSAELGRDRTVVGRSIRVYRPGFTDTDDAGANPIFHSGSIASPDALLELVLRAATRATRWRSSDDDVPTFATARLLIAEARSREAALVDLAPIEDASLSATYDSLARSPAASAAPPGVAEVREPELVQPLALADYPPDAMAGMRSELTGLLALVTEVRESLAGALKQLHDERARGASLQKSFDAQRDELTRLRDVLEEERGQSRERMAQAKVDLEGLREDGDRMRKANRALRRTLSDMHVRRDDDDVDAEVTFPNTFDEIEDWSARYLGDDVILTQRAIKTAMKSPLANPKLAYQALWLLKNEYLAMCMGDREAAAMLDQKSAALGIEICKVGQGNDHHMFKDQYQVSYQGKSYTMDRHVSGSSSRDPRQTLRIYFAYLEAPGVIVCGHLPSHLDNRLS